MLIRLPRGGRLLLNKYGFFSNTVQHEAIFKVAAFSQAIYKLLFRMTAFSMGIAGQQLGRKDAAMRVLFRSHYIKQIACRDYLHHILWFEFR